MAEEMKRLAEQCEAATGADRELDCRIWTALQGGCFDTYKAVVPDLSAWQAPWVTSSLDAAMTLVPEGHWHGYYACDAGFVAHCFEPIPDSGMHDATAATPALALTAACLRALATSPNPSDQRQS